MRPARERRERHSEADDADEREADNERRVEVEERHVPARTLRPADTEHDECANQRRDNRRSARRDCNRSSGQLTVVFRTR